MVCKCVGVMLVLIVSLASSVYVDARLFQRINRSRLSQISWTLMEHTSPSRQAFRQ